MAAHTDRGASKPGGLSLTARALRELHRRGIRGQTRATYWLANRIPSLRTVPIALPGCPPLFVDLREAQAHELLKGTPWRTDPWDAAERAVLRRIIRSGDVVFDVGANIGYHTVLMSALVGAEGRVVAIEPNPALAFGLDQTTRRLENADAVPLALSDEDRGARLFVPDFSPMASLADWTRPEHSAGHVRTLCCQMRRLDGLVADGTLPRPDVVKCDVEGAELMVFRGARDVLDQRTAPIVIFEVNQSAAAGFGFDRTDAMNFLATLSAAEFRFYQVRPDGALDPAPTLLPKFCNLVAAPHSRTERIAALLVA
jgi:FkbM family methyltransferase